MLKIKTILLFLSFIAIFFLFSGQNIRAQSCTGTVTFSCPQWTCSKDPDITHQQDGVRFYLCSSLGGGVEQFNCFLRNGTCMSYADSSPGGYYCNGGYGGCDNNSCSPASYTGYQACGGGGSSTTPTPVTITPTPTTPAGGGVGGCKANGESCAGGGGACCSGYCNGSVCAQRVCN